MPKPFIPVILWAIVILILSISPLPNMPEDWTDLISLDKLAHAFVYGLLTYLGIRALKRIGSLNTPKIWLVILLSSIYGISLEGVQFTFFPGRYFETLDIIANIIGSLLGAAIFYFFELRKPEAR